LPIADRAIHSAIVGFSDWGILNGALVHWCIGALVHWRIGALSHAAIEWHIASFRQSPDESPDRQMAIGNGRTSPFTSGSRRGAEALPVSE
jgi:hypothetical protein